MNRILSGVLLFTLAAAQAWAQQVVTPAPPPPIQLRGQLASAADTVPPYDSTAVDVKAKLIASGKRSYPEQLERAGIGGTVTFQFVIKTSGRVDPNSVRTVQATNSQFRDAALTMLLTAEFQPALKDGRQVAMKAQQVITFKP